MEIIKQEEETPKQSHKKKWSRPKLYWGKEIGFNFFADETVDPYHDPS
jgi:hypothetical protein